MAIRKNIKKGKKPVSFMTRIRQDMKGIFAMFAMANL
jgi:hypothetical protein